MTPDGRSPRRPRGLLLDLGDTLLRFVRFDSEAGLERLFAEAEVPAGVTLEAVRLLSGELFQHLASKRQTSDLEVSMVAFNRLLFELLGVRFPYSFEEVTRRFWEAAAVSEPMPHLDRLLAAADDLGLPAGVVSNAGFPAPLLEAELERHGLHRCLRFVMVSVDYGLCKPDPYLMRAAARRLGVAAEDIWFIGDTPAADIAGANRAGMVSVLYDSRGVDGIETGPDQRPVFTVGDWADLAELLRQHAAD